MDFSDVAEGELDPVHPGQILLEDFCGLWGYPSTGAKQAVGRSSSFLWHTPGETLMRATK